MARSNLNHTEVTLQSKRPRLFSIALPEYLIEPQLLSYSLNFFLTFLDHQHDKI